MSYKNIFGAEKALDTAGGKVNYYNLGALEDADMGIMSRLPFSIRVLLESLLRICDGQRVSADDVKALAKWAPRAADRREIGFMPARVLLQDFTGVPAVVDLAAMRSAMTRLGSDPKRINPLIPVDLVVDHSVQVDHFRRKDSLDFNTEMEFKRNMERYSFLHWGKDNLDNFRVVPPSTGIVHQVNLEYLASVVQKRTVDGKTVVFPDSLIGTDSHTTMINGLGVLGWGVGGIEAEAVMLGQLYYMITPDVVGFKIKGEMKEGITATDLVLTITQILREKKVVGKFVEFYGEGLRGLTLADRATIANMAPEYGATMGYFPVDDENLNYLRGTGRSADLIDLVERYTKEQGLFRSDLTPDPEFTETVELDLGTVEPSLAGPKRPQDRIALGNMRKGFHTDLSESFKKKEEKTISFEMETKSYELTHGSVVIAAITSCTNTSNPSVMIGAGLVAKRALEKGLTVAPYVKTSLAPGSRVVTAYLEKSGLLPSLEELGFGVVGYGCTTCIGNSGPLPDEVTKVVVEDDLVVASVLSGNRNFEGRINPHIKANYLASPPLVVAFAIAGRVNIDLTNKPLGKGSDGEPVYLKDIWPTSKEIRAEVTKFITANTFQEKYSHVFDGNKEWNNIPSTGGDIFEWDKNSTYIQEPAFFNDMTREIPNIKKIENARVLVLLGDSVTTDHISPAGAIPEESPAGIYLKSHGINKEDFNSFGSRRGNHEVMVRGTFGNIRLKNILVEEKEGYYTRYFPGGEETTIYEAAMRYHDENRPLIIIAGKEYGTGSSRDWAAKGTFLLGVKAVIAESYERIHRSNLVGMGVLPLQFSDDDSWQSLGLDGLETYSIEGLNVNISPGRKVTVIAKSDNGEEKRFEVTVRLDSKVEVKYYKNEGILQTVLREFLKE